MNPMLFYYVWPLMKYFRHIFLLTPAVRLILCFIAGFGFERFIEFLSTKNPKTYKSIQSLIVLFLMITCVITIFFQNDRLLTLFFHTLGYDQVQPLVQVFSSTMFILTAKLFLFTITIYLLLKWSNKFQAKHIVIILLFLHSVDLCAYWINEMNNRTTPLNSVQQEILKFQKLEFQKRRVEAVDFTKRRGNFFNHELLSRSQNYWTLNAFLFRINRALVLKQNIGKKAPKMPI